MGESKMTLDLAIATHRPEGIRRVAAMNLPRVEGVRYVVSWQKHEDAPVPPELIERNDLVVHRFDACGQSLNRNNAIAHCKAQIILHADDDIIYTARGLQAIIKVFEDNPQVDLATFRSVHDGMERFPQISMRLRRKLPKNYYAATFEIAFRRSSAGFLRCCPELGLGSKALHGAEDEMFLMSAIRRGLDCHFFPVTICKHPGESTGTKASLTNENLQAAGCVIALVNPLSALLRIPLKAWRVSRRKQSGFLRALFRITRGALMAPGVLRRNHDTLW